MKLKKLIAAAAAVTTAVALTACGSSDPESTAGGSGGAAAGGKTITWWATNQSTSLDADAAVLKPELAKFEQQTGIKVNLEVIGWPDLYGRITSAITSGKGPDVVSIGNTWSSSLQSTGAFTEFDDATLTEFGGKDRFLAASMGTTGAEGQTPTSVPLIAQAYGLFYNKAMFTAAGLEPPKTWEELTDAAAKLTKSDGSVYGVTFPGAAYTSSLHLAFIFGRQHGATPFDASGKPTFATDQQVAGIKQYTDLWQKGYINPSDVQLTSAAQAAQGFAAGKAAMLLAQNGSLGTIKNSGMTADQFGVVPIPMPSPMPAGGADVTSFAAGINISIFADSPNQDSSKALIKFLTTDEEQKVIAIAYGSLPVVNTVPASDVGDAAVSGVFQNVLANTAESLPRVANEGEYETNVGNAVGTLLQDIVAGKTVDDAAIMNELTAAQQKMG